MKKIAFILCSIIAIGAHAQTNPLKITGYVESYYNVNLRNVNSNSQANFIYSFNRQNELNINLGFIKANYEKNNVRANLALMTGTYAQANLAGEPSGLRNIYEANTGVKISKNKNLWIDAGVFASHIGFESAVGKDCWSLTRSILADNSPYYEAGVKVSYTSDNEKWFLSGLLLNGWQRIQRPNKNSTPALGHQLTFKPNSKITLNSSSFVGSDMPDSTRLMRYFHNFYGQFQVNNRLGLIVGLDVGAQQKQKSSATYNTWYAPILIAQYAATAKINVAARAEYYSDKNQVIIATNTQNGFDVYGYSLNVDYKIQDNVLWRVECRNLKSKDQIFNSDNPQNQNTFLTTSLAISF
ncbi:MAG: porin [Sphingobacteriaceae bacterium]|nr:porin [Sphingobacteriaceae bacterium]